MKRLIRRMAPLPVAGFVGLIILSVIATVSASASDPVRGRYTFIDNARQTTFAIDLDPAAPNLGEFTFGVAGVGLFRSVHGATVAFNSDHSVVIQYSGPATLDRTAAIDFVFALTRGSGLGEPVTVQLQAQVNPDRITSSAQFWFGGTQYKLVDTKPASDAGPAVTLILNALRDQDWSAIYDLSFSRLRATVTRTAFVAKAAAGWSGRGTITSAIVNGAIQTSDGRAGFNAARASVSITLTLGGV
ncbi:MAG: hypothetical protein WCG47_28410, partial [Dermatophilaceae bacterium]